MTTNLPEFIYHPDPILTGYIEISDEICYCCGQARGYIYTGPVHSIEELKNCLCPWCIADGSAHEKFNASFIDDRGIGGYGTWESVSKDIVKTVAFQTPGFDSWQAERWWTHCSDAAMFMGAVGYEELKSFGKHALAAIAEEVNLEGEELDIYLKALSKNGSPTAYLFKCRHCGKFGGYSDCD